MKYSLGLDIGVTSVGWAVIDLDKQRIHDVGVRIFERAEDPQKGTPLAEPRRLARSARRRLRRRRQRLNAIKRFFESKGLLTREEIDALLAKPYDPYELRVKALNEKLDNDKLFQVIYSISKKRGYRSNRKIDASESSGSETGRVLTALSENEKLLRSNQYRTAGEALLLDPKFKDHKRNKYDDYTNSFARADFLAELELILKTQQKLGLDVTDEEIQELLFGVDETGERVSVNAVMYQRPFMIAELMQKMIGECTFEPGEKRAPRGSYSFEKFRLLSDLMHASFILKDGYSNVERPKQLAMTSEMARKVMDAAHRQSTPLTYKKVRQVAGVGDDYRFSDVRGKKAVDDPYGEKNKFGSLKAYHDVLKAFKSSGLEGEWATVGNDEELLDDIALVLSMYKTDEELRGALSGLKVSNAAREALLSVKPANFASFGHLSVKALRKITPHLLTGMTYDKACEAAGYDFRAKVADLSQISNPVVKRAVNQTLKVVEAIVAKYGKPYFIRVESSRDLAKNFKDRKAIEREQQENQVKNERYKEFIGSRGVVAPTGLQITKYKLYLEQGCKCMYSGDAIDVDELFADANAYQIDHIIPFSRSGNDGMANKVLVKTAENQLKGNKTPYEAFGPESNPEKWAAFIKRVEATYHVRAIEGTPGEKADNYRFNSYGFKKKANLLVQEYKRQGWNERALNDTRYISRFVQNYLRQTVDMADGPDKQRVTSPNGTLTAYMRRRWGLSKIREQDVLHHATDAAIVAVMSPSMVLQANLYAKSRELRYQLQRFKTLEQKVDMLTGEVLEYDDEYVQASAQYAAHKVLSEDHFPVPWPRFRDEVDRRTRPVGRTELRNLMDGFENYDVELLDQIRPIFVSRMSKHKMNGQAHQETLRSRDVNEQGMHTVRTKLSSVKLAQLELSPVKQTDPQLYQTLKTRLESHGNDPAKAFSEPVFKLRKDGSNAHEVRAIKVASNKVSGYLINDGKAFVNNGAMARLDVYRKVNAKGKMEHFFVPVYVRQLSLERKGQKITKIYPELKGSTDVDESFVCVAKLHPNTYVRFEFDNDETVEGYYVTYNIANGQVSLIRHLSPGKDSKDSILVSARSASTVYSCKVDILGTNVMRAD